MGTTAKPAHLPREVQTHMPKEQTCPDCSGAFHKLGEDVSEVLEHVPVPERTTWLGRFPNRRCLARHRA